MIVSLEAIFLSTFVLISQNRADERRVILADTEWQLVQDAGHQNERLISIFGNAFADCMGPVRSDPRRQARGDDWRAHPARE